MDILKGYHRGFNSGYLIRKNHPLLMKSLIKGSKANLDYMDGLIAGSHQYEKEVQAKMSISKGRKGNKGILVFDHIG